jgi:hypothetical protein
MFEDDVNINFFLSIIAFAEEKLQLLWSRSFVDGDRDFFVSLEVKQELDLVLIFGLNEINDEVQVSSGVLVVVELDLLEHWHWQI